MSVPQPFVAETGFVAEEFTQEYAAVFFIREGADAVIRNVHVMGGGIVKAESTNDACYGVRNELKRPERANGILADVQRFLRRENLKLTRRERLSLLEAAHPNAMGRFWSVAEKVRKLWK